MRTTLRAVTCAAALVLSSALLPTSQASAAAGVFGFGPATFVNSAAPAAFFSAAFAGEPSLGVNGKTGATLYMAGTDIYKVGVNKATSPVGVSWSNVTPLASLVNLDPILATDRVTGVTLGGGDTGPCGALFRSTDDGASWGNTAACVGVSDHPTVGFGPAVPDALSALPTSDGRVAYFCQQQVLDECSASRDGGLTWSPGVAQNGCLSLFGHLKSSPDGTAYVPSVNCFDAVTGKATVGAFYTRDNGVTWDYYGIAGAPTPARGFDATIATTPDNTVYESWARDGDFHPVVTVSKDHGTSWTPPVDLAGTVSPPLVATTFQTATSGDNGRVSVAYLGTRVGTPGLTPFDSGYHGVWDLYVSTTLDGGATWSTVQATTEPVQRGSISDGGTTSSGQRNLLDFMDAQTLTDGRVAVAYADGCLGVCNGPAGTEAQSVEAYATVAVQDTGRGLYAAQDVTPVSAPSAPVLTGTATSTGNALSWTVADDGGARVSSYAVSRGTGQGPLSPLATTTLPSYTDSSAVAGTTYRYAVTATNTAGTSAASNVLSLVRTSVPGASTLTASGDNGAVSLTWTTPVDGGSPVTGYQVSRGGTPLATVGTTTSYVDRSAVPGTTYAYTVAAVNSVGTGAASNVATAFATTVPGAPVLSATAGKGSVTLTWTVPADGYTPITSWTVLRGTTPGGEAPIQTLSSGTSYVDVTGTAGTTYFYRVVANNKNGAGAPSNEVSATPRKATGR